MLLSKQGNGQGSVVQITRGVYGPLEQDEKSERESPMKISGNLFRLH